MKKTKDIISQENKFLRLCGDKYRDKIKKRIPMTVGDFNKFMYLFDALQIASLNGHLCHIRRTARDIISGQERTH